MTPTDRRGAADAASEPVDLPPERKTEILELDERLDTLDHFSLLGVPVDADVATIKRAFYEASKRFHPDRFFGREIGSYRARIERIFRRFNEANSVLSDAEKRAAYLAQNPQLRVRAQSGQPKAAELQVDALRSAERRARMARHPYMAKQSRLTELVKRADGHLVTGEYNLAVAELEAALSVEQSPELASKLTEAKDNLRRDRATNELKKGRELERAGNLEEALKHYRNAATTDPQSGIAAVRAGLTMVRLDHQGPELKLLAKRAFEQLPKDADAKVLYAQVLIEDGDKKRARELLEDALRLDPAHEEAKRQLKKVRWTF